MQNLKFILPFALFACLLAACSKDGFLSSAPTVNAAFAGRVIDETGEPLSGAQVRVGGELATTDANGVFRLGTMRLSSDNAKLMVSKIGYFDFSRAFYVENNDLQTVTIQLLRKDQIGTLNGAAGGTVEMPGGATLVFPAGAFMDANGNAYNGTVRIYARSLNPASVDFAQQMPGDLRGISTSGDDRALGTFGMVGVELAGQNGQEIRIRQGVEVEIHLPIAPSQRAGAPAQISLWHYDLQQARWIEEGTAQRSGDKYIGRVQHFTFWSFSTAFNLVQIKGSVFLVDVQHPLAGAVVRLTMTSDSSKAYATTNANGEYKGGVPMGETFVMDILNECGEVIFSQNVGPFNEPTNAPDVVAPNNGTHTVSLTGRLLDCAGAPIKNGYAQVLLGNLKWVAFTGIDGTFTLNKVRCDTSVATGVVIGFDLQNLHQSAPDTISVPPNGVTVGDLAVCDSLAEFIIFSLDYNDYVISTPVGGVLDSLGMRTFLNGYSTAQQDVGISMEFPSNGQPGSFTLSNLHVNTLTWNSGVSNINVELVDPGYAIGDAITGTFEGTFTDQFGVSHTLSGSFQVKRDW